MTHSLPDDNATTAADFLHTIAPSESMVEQSSSYRLAFDDPVFLARSEVRGVRFQLELLKPDLILRENQIDHTIVVFGSARFVSAQDAEAMLVGKVMKGSNGVWGTMAMPPSTNLSEAEAKKLVAWVLTQ